MTKKIFTLFSLLILISLTHIFLFPMNIIPKKNKIIYLHEQKMRSIAESELNTFIKNGNVIIIFYEDWCGSCKRMTPILEELVEKIDDIVFIKIKRSLYREIFDHYGLTTIPAMLFCKKGQIVHIRPQSATKEEMIHLVDTVFYKNAKHHNSF